MAIMDMMEDREWTLI